MAQWVKDLALLLLCLRSLLRLRFNPWPRNFHRLQANQQTNQQQLMFMSQPLFQGPQVCKFSHAITITLS